MTLSEKENIIYKKLAVHLDHLPGGYPETESGIELKILKKLFTLEEAELALHLTLISETADVVALRAKMDVDKVSSMLSLMADKGLIFDTKKRDEPDTYMAAQFVVGIWEYQVGSLDRELVQMMDEYIPHLFKADEWQKAPQMRIIPVKKSIDTKQKIMSYEQVEELINKKKNFVVTPCICRLEKKELDKNCDRPIETCISFGGEDDYYVRNGLGRQTDREEILKILKEADKAGLVIQPSNGKRITWICLCCGCCCGVLRTLNSYPFPSELVASPFIAVKDDTDCNNCGICIDRCQTKAITVEDKKVDIEAKRCIGCGLCVSTCPKNCLSLERKDSSEIPKVPESIVSASVKMLFERKKANSLKFIKMFAESKRDRLRAYLKK